ncbi:MAG: hypothetical protein MI867_09775 [Pseudomonadales bacterium]|nr:hypothetical protein [Pseudomonadales bacterium]
MKLLSALTTGALALTLASPSIAWKQPTHKQEVIDALHYMGSDYADADMKRAYDFYVNSANGNADKAADALGQACYDVDNFKDVHLGSWWRGYWSAPLFGLAHSIVGYNAYHHFVTMSRGTDAHGNEHGGYNYRHRTVNGSMGKGEFFDIDMLAAFYLWNTELKKSDFKTTEANYRQGSYSNYNEHYRDFQDIPWQPAPNAGKYWFEQFQEQPTFQTMGYALHFLTDSGQVHHTMSTSANHHAGWEAWVEDNYFTENLSTNEAIHNAVGRYNPQDSFRDLVHQLAEEAYSRPEPLYATDHATRLSVAEVMIPETIAATVAVLTKGVNCLHGECGN